MAADELSLFDVENAEDRAFEVYLDGPNSPEIPLQSVAKPGQSRRKRKPKKRAVLDSSSSSSGSESEDGAGSSINSYSTPKRQNIINRPSSGNESVSVLLEMKEMLSKMCEKVDQNDRALKELKKDM